MLPPTILNLTFKLLEVVGQCPNIPFLKPNDSLTAYRLKVCKGFSFSAKKTVQMIVTYLILNPFVPVKDVCTISIKLDCNGL